MALKFEHLLKTDQQSCKASGDRWPSKIHHDVANVAKAWIIDDQPSQNYRIESLFDNRPGKSKIKVFGA